MKPVTKLSRRQLHARLEAVLEELLAREPILTRELTLLQSLIAARDSSTGGDFAAVRAPRSAIELCLAERDAFMTKQEIVDRLTKGGFQMHAVNGRWLVNDTINYLLKNNKLIRRGEGEKWETLVGLPEWANRNVPETHS